MRLENEFSTISTIALFSEDFIREICLFSPGTILQLNDVFLLTIRQNLQVGEEGTEGEAEQAKTRDNDRESEDGDQSSTENGS